MRRHSAHSARRQGNSRPLARRMERRKLSRSGRAALAICLARQCSEVQAEEIRGNNAFASHLVLGHADGSWLEASQVPILHGKGLLGIGQTIGLGDTGVLTDSCSFHDAAQQVPFGTTSSSHRKIAGYFTAGGDTQDGPHGHGTHIAGSILGQVEGGPQAGQPDNGVAPAARLVVVDVEKVTSPGNYQVPYNDIGRSYFDIFRKAEANIVCSPWSFPENADLDQQIDLYVYNHPEFLPIYPSGNAYLTEDHTVPVSPPDSPCVAKNALCVGASFTARQAYLERPSFVHTALQLGSSACYGPLRDGCAEELEVYPAIFGATSPSPENMATCVSVASECLSFGGACPECAFDPSVLAVVSDVPAFASSPLDGCQPLTGFPAGAACVVQRGSCYFATKAKHCSEAGAVGVVIVNGAGQPPDVMTSIGSDADGLTLPVVLISHKDGEKLLATGKLVTFPVVPQKVDPHARAPFSKYGSHAGRFKPEVVFPGDGIASTSVDASCGFVQQSGTSQSCGVAAGTVALLREYLQEWADPTLARLPNPWASTLKAALITASEVHRISTSTATLWTEEVGFGLPALASVLPVPAGPGLFAVQSQSDSTSTQRFCFELGSQGEVARTVTLAWTDPPHRHGQLVHDLDLEVSCDANNWGHAFGNGGASHDRSNNVEKVLLDSHIGTAQSGLCIVEVTAQSVSERQPQSFSLVVAGALLPSPECRASAQPSCVNGNPVQVAATGSWACRCTEPWVGAFCDQTAKQLELSTSEQSKTYSLRALQWSFFEATASCGAGSYELVLEETSSSVDPQFSIAATWGHFEVLSFSPEMQSVTVTSSTEAIAGGHRITKLVQIPEDALQTAAKVSFALHSSVRDQPVSFSLRWQPHGDLVGTCASESAATGATGSTSIVIYVIIGMVALVLLASVVACILLKTQKTRQVYEAESSPVTVGDARIQSYPPKASEAWQSQDMMP
mmetsp:Transcript_101235/g.179836  ORF Transcript_101235/g.179836 Transcript_101235/m.179836 type:complete len:961 (+) Transcript_101235:38-2920(+)